MFLQRTPADLIRTTLAVVVVVGTGVTMVVNVCVYVCIEETYRFGSTAKTDVHLVSYMAWLSCMRGSGRPDRRKKPPTVLGIGPPTHLKSRTFT